MIFRAAALAFLGFAASLAVQRILAEVVFRQDTASAVERAISIQGANSFYYERLAALDPEHAGAMFARAVGVNPRSSGAWIELGLAAEHAGDFTDAERALLRAAAADGQYLPAWILANFYFRRIFFQHTDARSFWTWARRAAALGSADLKPLLMLCDRVEPDRFPERLGESPGLDRAYLDFFTREQRLDSAQRVALKMAGRRTAGAAPGLIDFTDRRIRAGNGNAAIEMWNALAAAQFIPFPPADPLHPLTNGDLKIAPTGQGFDWRLPQSEGVSPERRNARLAFSFSGSQPEACPLPRAILDAERPALPSAIRIFGGRHARLDRSPLGRCVCSRFRSRFQ